MIKKLLKSMLALTMFFSSFSLSVFAETIETELIVNNATTGTELNQFEFVGDWRTSVNYPDRFYNVDEH